MFPNSFISIHHARPAPCWIAFSISRKPTFFRAVVSVVQMQLEHEVGNTQARVSVGLIILKLIYSKTTLARKHLMNMMYSSESSILKSLQYAQIYIYFPVKEHICTECSVSFFFCMWLAGSSMCHLEFHDKNF